MATDEVTHSPRERAILHSVLGCFAERIERVAIFGSRALGRARPDYARTLFNRSDLLAEGKA